MHRFIVRMACGVVLPAVALAVPARAEPPKLPVPAVDQSAVAQRGYFYVGGKYVGDPGKEIMQGQIYVEVLAPKDVRRPYPLVLIHGAAQTATNWMGTPDGRKGWAEYFVEQGYVVYMIDQPMRGRSAAHPGDGPTRMFTAKNEQLYKVGQEILDAYVHMDMGTMMSARQPFAASARVKLDNAAQAYGDRMYDQRFVPAKQP